MRVHVDHQALEALQRDLEGAAPMVYREGRSIVEDTARTGRDTAKRLAQAHNAGSHAKRYANTITADRRAQTFQGFGGGEVKASFGPEPRGQGLLAHILEDGATNRHGGVSMAQENLDQSADVIRNGFYRQIDNMLDRAFSPNGDR